MSKTPEYRASPAFVPVPWVISWSPYPMNYEFFMKRFLGLIVAHPSCLANMFFDIFF